MKPEALAQLATALLTDPINPRKDREDAEHVRNGVSVQIQTTVGKLTLWRRRFSHLASPSSGVALSKSLLYPLPCMVVEGDLMDGEWVAACAKVLTYTPTPGEDREPWAVFVRLSGAELLADAINEASKGL